MEDNSLVSVIMGTYNCEITLDECIQSILNQTYTNWEFVICDDQSTDGTYEKLLQYQSLYPEKFIILSNEENSKLAATLNHCLRYANGYYIARMDADDISEYTRFEKQLNFLRANPSVDLVGTAMQYFDKNGSGHLNVMQENPTADDMKRHTTFNHATIMTYKRVYNTLNGYTVCKRTQRGQDVDLWFRFFREGFTGANLREPLYLCREDLNAIKRRTFMVRWRTFQTIVLGYQMLGFPWYRYIRPTLELGKGLIPSRMMLLYRKWQVFQYKKRIES